MISTGQEVQAVAQETHKAGILLPAAATAPLPEDIAWNMIAAEGGVVGVVGVVVVATLWKLLRGIIDETRKQNAELVTKQSESISALKESVADVKVAIQVSDSNNQHALKHLGEVVQAAVARLDRHEERLGALHERSIEAHHRISYLERGAGSSSGGNPASGVYPIRPLNPQGRAMEPQHP